MARRPPLPPNKLRVLRVRADRRGELWPVGNEPPRTDDGWWDHVLHDARLRAPSGVTIQSNDAARYRLDKHPWSKFWVSCECGQQASFRTADLLQAFAGDTNIRWLASELMDCGHRNKVGNQCHARPAQHTDRAISQHKVVSINTIAELIEQQHELVAYCETRDGPTECGHSETLDLQKLAQRLGPDHSTAHAALIPRLKCSACGGKKISLRLHPPTGRKGAAGSA